MSRTGRPSLLTPELQAEIVKAVEGGAPPADACAAANISLGTFYRWQQIGRRSTSGKYRDFFEALDSARARARRRAQKVVHDSFEVRIKRRKHAKRITDPDGKVTVIEEVHEEEVLPNPVVGLKYLERRDPENWALRKPEPVVDEQEAMDRVDEFFKIASKSVSTDEEKS